MDAPSAPRFAFPSMARRETTFSFACPMLVKDDVDVNGGENVPFRDEGAIGYLSAN